MATSTLSPQPVPSGPQPDFLSSSSSPTSASSSTPTIMEEVYQAQLHLRTRLAGAITASQVSTPEALLPTVPLIDIGPSFDGQLSSRQAVAQQIREACLTTGFFQISNHGISDAAMAGVLRQAERFFHSLTPAQKDRLHIRFSPLFRGYEPGHSTYVNPDEDEDDVDNNNNNNNNNNNSSSSNAKAEANPNEQTIGGQPESRQGFNFGYEPALDATGPQDGQYVELDGEAPREPDRVNVWPAEEDLPGFKAGVAAYYGAVLALARHLLRLFALSLRLDESYFEPLTTHPGGVGALLYYPAVPGATPDDHDDHAAAAAAAEKKSKLGLGAHTDYDCFTLLLTSDSPGLEILFPGSAATDDKPMWRACPVRWGTLTVNVADFLMRWTNGLYRSTVHRVLSAPGTPARYSVPFFFSINYDADVRPLPESAVGRSVFRPMRAGQYVLERLRATRALDEAGREVAGPSTGIA